MPKSKTGQSCRVKEASGQLLKREIQDIRCRMDAIRNQFEQETDPILIDCHIYELKGAELRYQFLLRRFKTLEAETVLGKGCPAASLSRKKTKALQPES